MRQPPDLEIVNRTLGESLRKSEADVIKLRAALLNAANSLSLAGYHASAEQAMQAWKETVS